MASSPAWDLSVLGNSPVPFWDDHNDLAMVGNTHMKVQHQRRGLLRLWGLTVAAIAVPQILGTPAQAALDAAAKALNRVVMIEGKIEGAETFGAGIILGRQGNRLYIV